MVAGSEHPIRLSSISQVSVESVDLPEQSDELFSLFVSIEI